MRPVRTLAVVAALVIAAPAALSHSPGPALSRLGIAPAGAQEVRVSGGDRSRAVAVMREVLARAAYLRLDRDTVLPPTFHARGDVVVYDAEVRLEGAVDGTVVVIGGHLFIRPGARVAGPIAVVGGGVYPSSRASTGEILEAEPGTEVVLEGDSAAVADPAAPRVRVIPPPRPSLLAFAPGLPTYDRVNGLTLSAGAMVRPTRHADGPAVAAWASYRAGRESFGGGARVDWPLGVENVHLTVEASRGTHTVDAWIRGDLSNSVSAALWGKDYRDYWESDRVALTVHRPVGKPLVAGESWLGPRLSLLVSDDRSLATAEVWSLLGDDLERPNPPIDEGRLVSLTAGAALHWMARTSSLVLDGSVEQGLVDAGDFEFTRAVLHGTYQAVGIRRHQMRVEFRVVAPLGDDAAPRQRWGILGGSGTLPTEEVARFRGDHLVFVESAYGIPLARIRVPLLGSPSLELTHAAGAAWVTGDDMPPWVQNAGVGLAFPLFRVRVLVNPARHPLEPKLSFKLSVPYR